ncbi:hypothetical protein [Spirosoma rigui]|uniref:hypothetical protein n=1 Tax=Spirosoma rigui TaxID=564064 RepID=UPI0009B0B867|nr:hypothetical protein [Spirosoma rigui]
MKGDPNVKAGGNQISRSLFVVLLVGMGIPTPGQTLSGNQIFKRMIRVYAEAKTYQDQGSLQTGFYQEGQTHPERNQVKKFATAYSRATGQFSFWYENKNRSFFDLPDKWVIWRQDHVVHQWWSMHESLTQKQPLADALGALTGVSGTASRKIPGLLLKEPIGAGWGIDDLKNVKLLGFETQGDRSCYRLSGVLRGKDRATLWIDQRTFLLIRVDEEHALGEEGFKTSISYQPKINRCIPEEFFIFEPPRAYWLWFGPILKYVLIILAAVLWFWYIRVSKQRSLHYKS